LPVTDLNPWLPYGRDASKDERFAIQLARLPVVPSIIRPQSHRLTAFLTVVTLGLYAAYWLQTNRDAFHRATDREEQSTALVTVLALCTCMVGAFPVLYDLQRKARCLCREEPKSQSFFLLLVVVNILVPFSGLAIAIALCQQALNHLEHHARVAHGHTRLVPMIA
jgi:O-antigen ligase